MTKTGWTRARGSRNRTAHAVAVAALGIVLLAVPSAGAQEAGVVEVPLGTVVRTAPGVETVIGSTDTPPELVGAVCNVETRAENNRSVHPGNNLVVSSGSDSVTLFDVEGSSGKITTAASPLTLGADIAVTLLMGPDGVYSAGASAFVVLDCAPPSTSTTSTTVAPTTTSAGSTTTSSPPSTSVTSTVPPTTSIEGPTQSTVPPTTTVPDGTTEPPLAFTGPAETLLLVVFGLVLLDLGYLAFSARKPGRGSSTS